ncbi:MAG: LysE family transporter [Methanomicrobiaceae archaeon]|nr:LysE family transporter [Methanomicrobiaceae archaeon]
MFTLPEFFVLSFLIGLTGALVPGPTLIATINESLKSGWTAGPRVTSGHIAIELAIAIAIVFGMSAMLSEYTNTIAVLGGAVLVIFGIMNLISARNIKISSTGAPIEAGPFLAGIITSVTNPYFWIWWLTTGAGFLLAGLKGGVIFAAAFMIGHWFSDLGWFTFVSAGISKGKNVMPERVYRGIIAGCGIFLVGFGLWFISGTIF